MGGLLPLDQAKKAMAAAEVKAKQNLRAAPTNVRSWEANGLNADAFEPFMTHLGHRPEGAGDRFGPPRRTEP